MIEVARLNPRVKRRLIEAGYTDEQIECMTPLEALDKWLRWEGIIGYTDLIVDTYEELKKARKGGPINGG